MYREVRTDLKVLEVEYIALQRVKEPGWGVPKKKLFGSRESRVRARTCKWGVRCKWRDQARLLLGYEKRNNEGRKRTGGG